MASKPQRKRFQEYTDDEINDKRRCVQKMNTLKSDVSTSNQLQAYLKQLDQPIAFWEYNAETLNEILGKFWFSARQCKLDESGK